MDSWHSYSPLSSSRTDFIRNDQWPICLACSTRNRSSLLYVDRPTVNNWKSRLRIHDTYFAIQMIFENWFDSIMRCGTNLPLSMSPAKQIDCNFRNSKKKRGWKMGREWHKLIKFHWLREMSPNLDEHARQWWTWKNKKKRKIEHISKRERVS